MHAADVNLGTPAKTTTTIVGRLENIDKTVFNMTTRITLNHQQYTTYSRADGSFAIFNVPPGIHQLDIQNNNYHFGHVKIQLLENDMDAPKCLEYAYPGALKQVIAYPLVLRPHATYTYFEKRQGLSLFSILKNPMVLMMVFSLGLMFLMPKMMEGLGTLGDSLVQKRGCSSDRMTLGWISRVFIGIRMIICC
jgi:ER membrane protein complex subunit 7